MHAFQRKGNISNVAANLVIIKNTSAVTKYVWHLFFHSEDWILKSIWIQQFVCLYILSFKTVGMLCKKPFSTEHKEKIKMLKLKN